MPPGASPGPHSLSVPLLAFEGIPNRARACSVRTLLRGHCTAFSHAPALPDVVGLPGTASGAAHAHAEHLRGRYEDALFDYRGPGGGHVMDGMVDGVHFPYAYGAGLGYAGHRGYQGRPVDWAKVCMCSTRKPCLLLLIACFVPSVGMFVCVAGDAAQPGRAPFVPAQVRPSMACPLIRRPPPHPRLSLSCPTHTPLVLAARPRTRRMRPRPPTPRRSSIPHTHPQPLPFPSSSLHCEGLPPPLPPALPLPLPPLRRGVRRGGTRLHGQSSWRRWRS